MEAKKNPDKDVYKNSGQYFLIGLSLSTAIMITAFEWRTELIPPIVTCSEADMPIVLPEIPQPKTESPKPLEEPIPESKQTSPSFTPVEVVDRPSEKNAETTPTFEVDSLAFTLQNVSLVDAPEADTSFFIFVEEEPEPVNGYKNFYQNISRNIKYPAQARRMNVEGNVFVEFIVNRKGDATNVTIIKGIGAGCDEEAKRMIALSKWEPGKQRGLPVRVKMVIPITFKLN